MLTERQQSLCMREITGYLERTDSMLQYPSDSRHDVSAHAGVWDLVIGSPFLCFVQSVSSKEFRYLR